MKCPYCSHADLEVLETREADESATRRRRVCRKCEKRFTTYERIENIDLAVIKKDNRREAFNREKLKQGIVKATEKRPISLDLVNQVVDEIEKELRLKETVEISSKTIGNLVLKKLKRIDKVAYIRFASVYLDFEEIADFEKVIEKLN